MDGPKLPLVRVRLPYRDEAEFVDRYAPHLARGGVFIATRSPKPEGTAVAFEFRLGDDSCPLAGEGVVVKSAAPEAGARAGMTLRFTRLDEGSQAVLDRAVAGKDADAEPTAGGPEAAAPWLLSPQTVPSDIAEARRRRRQSVLSPAAPEPEVDPAPAIGIDLGTTHARAAVVAGGRPQLLPLDGAVGALPAVVAVDDKGRVLTGTRARALFLLEPQQGVVAIKRLLGRRLGPSDLDALAAQLPHGVMLDNRPGVAVSIRGQRHAVGDLLANLLSEVRRAASEHLGKDIGRAVLAVPSVFGEDARLAVQDAASAAGLSVERMVSDAAAVGVAYAQARRTPRRRFLVYALGGGTFTATVLEVTGDEVEVIATGGDRAIGGAEFDRRVADELWARLLSAQPGLTSDAVTRERLRDAAESAKVLLSDAAETSVHVAGAGFHGTRLVDLDWTLTRGRMEELTADLLERTVAIAVAVLDDAGVAASAVDEVILVGGQAAAPAVRRRVAQAFGRPVRSDLGPLDAAALGAAIVARALDADEARPSPLRVTEVLGAAVGLSRRDGTVAPVLTANTALPCEKSVLLPVRTGVERRVALFQGQGIRVAPAEFLGCVGVPAEHRGEVSLILAADASGRVSVSMRRPEGGTAPLPIDPAGFSPEELAAIVAASPIPGLDEGRGVLARLLRGFRRV